VADPVVSAITAETQAAVRQMVADARAAASAITAEAQRSAVSAIASIHQSVTGAVADMRQSVTDAVSQTAHQIGADFAAHVNAEITTMTADFKQSHPAVAQATTDVVGYVDAVSTTATAVQNAAAQLKEVPSAVREMRTALRETLTEAGRLGQDFQRGFGVVRQGATSAAEGVGRFATASRGAATAVGGAVRNLAQLAAGMARAAVQTALATVRTVAMAVAQRVVAVATRLWAAMQMLLNIAMRLNPLGLIITGITLLVGLFVLAYQRSATFRAIVQGALRGVQVAIGWVVDAARAVFNWVKANWPLLLAVLTGPIGLAVLFITRHWDQIKAGVAAAKDFIVGTWNAVMGFIGGLPGRLTSIANQMWEGFKSAVRGAVNFLIDAWNRLDFGIHVHLPSWLGGMGFDIDDVIPDIPRLAEGALVPRRPGGVLALLGEGREDELVVPLSRVPALAARGQPVTVNVYPRAAQSEYEIGRVVGRELAWAAKH
jgi:phage-related protein